MGRIWLLLLVPACFRPNYAHTACGPADECPGALVCVQGFCELAVDGSVDSNGAPDIDGSLASDGSIPDGSVDAPSCFGAGLVRVCLATLPDHPSSLPRVAGPLDTNQDGACDQVVAQAGGPSLCVIVGTTVTVSGSLIATGARPLVLVGTDTVIVSAGATLDVSSPSQSPRRGAGGNEATCSPSGSGHLGNNGGGGGAGGSFGSSGGEGGQGDRGSLPGPAAGGAPGAPQPDPPVLRGGCSGGAGGSGGRPNGGAPGDGGGAVYLIAGNHITIDGDIFASGGGGGTTEGTAGREEGGGGGGSGGMIGVDAPMIEVAGRVVANGGGGGGGGGSDIAGDRGGDGTTTEWNLRAPAGRGGRGSSPNRTGGDGAQGTAAGATTNIGGEGSNFGGGGAGGGLGLIWTYGTLNGGAMMSPAPVQR